MSDHTHERTLGEARLDARYHATLQALNAKLFRRLKKLFSFITLASGTAAFTLVFQANPTLGAVAGGVLAILAILEQVVDPAACAAAHEEWAQRWGELVARTDIASLAEYDSKIEALRTKERDALDTLAPLAYNRNVIAAGYESWQMPLSKWQRLVSILV